MLDAAGEAGKGCLLARGTVQLTPPEWPDVASQQVQLQPAAEVSPLSGVLADTRMAHAHSATCPMMQCLCMS